MAPEVMMSGGISDSSASGYTFSADIWSVGCVVIGKILCLLKSLQNIFKNFVFSRNVYW